jgi:type I phosphodiesterase/nucleotide pyrophosphatase
MRHAVVGHGRNQRRWRMALAGAALLCLLLGLALRNGDTAVGAEGDGCTPTCVILIQVDGLEPKDVTQETTPYLWLLAHPNLQGQNIPGGALAQRSGWIWQAPRGVVSTGTAPATASLLTGGFPEKSGVPADDFYGPNEQGQIARQRLSAGGFGDTPHTEAGSDVAEPVNSLAVDTLVGIVRDTGGDAAVFLGDPGLAKMTEASSQGSPHWFPPGDEASSTYPEGQFTGDPRLCPIPRYPDGGAVLPGQQPAEENFNPSHCPANDLTTTNKAMNDLKQSASEGVGFTFIHLAELGAAKRLAADTDVDNPQPDDPNPTLPHPPQVPQALSDMDEAIATFAEQYAQNKPAKWQKTVLMVVGTNGYQRTPISHRIPDPENPGGVSGDPSVRDLSDYVAEFNGAPPGSLTLVPQGTMATIYYGLGGKGDESSRRESLDAIKLALMGDVNAACRQQNDNLGNCIRHVYYVDKDTPDTPDTAPKSWHLDARHPDTGARTRASGDLVVEFERGWAAGRAAGVPYQGGVTGQPTTNANTASAGGPQERAVAALINGPSQSSVPGAVRNLDSLGASQIGLSQIKYYPVSNGAVDPSDRNNPPPVDDPACPDTVADPGGLSCANDPTQVGDDAESVGHEAQPVTVDFALTISALMQLPFESHPDQLQGRVLQEAFLNALATPCVGDCEPQEIVQEEPEPPPLPPPPPPEIVQPEGFNFHGLVRDLDAIVVDSRNRPYARARRGSRLSTIRLEADFGRPETAVTLTFYRKATAGSRPARGARVVRLKPIARFDPFVVKRGHVTMRLKVPPLFKPTYVGIHVREIARTASGRRLLSGGQPCTKLKTRKPVPFRCTGPTRGVILPIADAGRLHKQKGVVKKPRSRNRR